MASTKEIEVVPMECDAHEYLNPYKSEVTLNDTVPKDKQLQAVLYETYQRNTWVTPDWVRRRLEEVEDADKLEEDIKKSKASEAQQPVPTGGVGAPKPPPGGQPGQGTGGPGDELERTAGPPFGSNLPGG